MPHSFVRDLILETSDPKNFLHQCHRSLNESATCLPFTRLYNGPVEAKGYPGEELIAEGMRDLQNGVESVAALLLSIGAPRLRRMGFSLPRTLPQPEHRLYRFLARENPDEAHSRYNALIRRLVSFERAVECGN